MIDRKSVSCVVTLIGGHCIRCQTATQTVPALSSGEAEYVGNVKGGSVGIGMQVYGARLRRRTGGAYRNGQ